MKTAYRKQIFYLKSLEKTSEVVIDRDEDKDLRRKLKKIDQRPPPATLCGVVEEKADKDGSSLEGAALSVAFALQIPPSIQPQLRESKLSRATPYDWHCFQSYLTG